MDSSDITQLKALETWLQQWQQWLDQWLACGVINPTPHAVAQLKQWAENSQAGGWGSLSELANIVIESDSVEARADAFLDLMVRYQVTAVHARWRNYN